MSEEMMVSQMKSRLEQYQIDLVQKQGVMLLSPLESPPVPETGDPVRGCWSAMSQWFCGPVKQSAVVHPAAEALTVYREYLKQMRLTSKIGHMENHRQHRTLRKWWHWVRQRHLKRALPQFQQMMLHLLTTTVHTVWHRWHIFVHRRHMALHVMKIMECQAMSKALQQWRCKIRHRAAASPGQGFSPGSTPGQRGIGRPHSSSVPSWSPSVAMAGPYGFSIPNGIPSPGVMGNPMGSRSPSPRGQGGTASNWAHSKQDAQQTHLAEAERAKLAEPLSPKALRHSMMASMGERLQLDVEYSQHVPTVQWGQQDTGLKSIRSENASKARSLEQT